MVTVSIVEFAISCFLLCEQRKYFNLQFYVCFSVDDFQPQAVVNAQATGINMWTRVMSNSEMADVSCSAAPDALFSGEDMTANETPSIEVTDSPCPCDWKSPCTP